MMKTLLTLTARLGLLSLLATASHLTLAESESSGVDQSTKQCASYLDHPYRLLHHTKEVKLCEIVDSDVVLFVNTASHCGFTKQFKGLESLYQKYKDQGLTVVGFASDDFNQESKDEAESAGICFINFGVTFTMFAPTSVKGANANPTFSYLNAASAPPAWNFNKYLVNLKTSEVQHFGSKVKPLNSALETAVRAMLLVNEPQLSMTKLN